MGGGGEHGVEGGGSPIWRARRGGPRDTAGAAGRRHWRHAAVPRAQGEAGGFGGEVGLAQGGG